jgi:hypothetical protein
MVGLGETGARYISQSRWMSSQSRKYRRDGECSKQHQIHVSSYLPILFAKSEECT